MMVERWLHAISLFSIVNIMLVVLSIVCKPRDASVEAGSLTTATTHAHRKTPADQPSKVEDSAIPENSSLAIKLSDEAPRVENLVPQPPAVEDLLMSELRKQAAESLPASFKADAKPIGEASTKSSTIATSNNESKSSDSNVALARSSALRNLSAVVDSLTQVEEQLKQLGLDQQAKQISIQVAALQQQIRELIGPKP